MSDSSTQLLEKTSVYLRNEGSFTHSEPKLLILFELDEHGRMKAKTRPWIDGTFQGPDQCMELLALHLHRLGASEAEVVTFLGDGAPWIWERVPWVVTRVGLRAGQAYQVTASLSLLAEEKSGTEASWTAIRFLEKHASAGHLRYREFRRLGVPMGSGAIESAIRRVVNLRLKGNGLLWYIENAEGMLVLRAAALTGRWQETLAQVRETMARDRGLDWQWIGPDMPEELKASDEIKPPEAQPKGETRTTDNAA